MTQSNQLERVLRGATREAGLRPALYRELLRSEIFVLADTPDGGKRFATTWLILHGNAGEMGSACLLTQAVKWSPLFPLTGC
jgi:hypothetical protein